MTGSASQHHRSTYRATIEVLGPVDDDGYDTLTVKAHAKAATLAEAIESAAAEIDISLLWVGDAAPTSNVIKGEITRRRDAAARIVSHHMPRDVLPPNEAARSVAAFGIVDMLIKHGLLSPEMPDRP